MFRASAPRPLTALALALLAIPAAADRRAVEIPPGMAVPEIRLTATRDAVSGWNLTARVSEFRFVPERAGRALIPGEGHAFVYVDGVEVARVYGPDFHLEGVPPGTREITYTLNANDHSVYTRAGRAISDSVTIVEPEPPPLGGVLPTPYHAPIALPAGSPLPEIEIAVSADPHSGWNVHAEVSRFDFTPRSVGAEPRSGEGHANLYVDGRKVARLYGRSYHLNDLEPGVHRIQISLIGNNHAPYVYRGEEIAGTIEFEVPVASR